MLFTELWPTHRGNEEEREVGMEERQKEVESEGWQATAIMKRIWRRPTVCWS